MEKPQIIKDVGFDFSWDYKKVWALNEPTVSIPIESLLWHFDIPFLDKKGTDDWNLTVWELLINPYQEDEHWKKILDADLQYPLDVMLNKGGLCLLDGLHRLAKCYLLGKKEVRVRIIPRSRIPEIIQSVT